MVDFVATIAPLVVLLAVLAPVLVCCILKLSDDIRSDTDHANFKHLKHRIDNTNH